MKAIKRIKEIKNKPLEFEEITDEGWYKVLYTGRNLLFLKNPHGILDVAVAFNEEDSRVGRVSHHHAWRDSGNKFVKLEDFSVEI